ncbi:DUF4291 domain-containing protein [Saprospira sp. CCB-QB6]|uniref:DUF4291 domain-containing protein n=1 Tax=Saprospira sp. CCB-QB6 TaxID=3023936 RepID=UPI00234A2133|nr:DUF4291 domain-containing protein [Saprospira sp. CCB-QB6]WCL82751.1 DUF4291 domain-containing protein [Saprospira sp. CCB-QB6]
MKTVNYQDYLAGIPPKGQHILAQERGDEILVYQAFRPEIAQYALAHQQFGGAHYSFSRMTWIKPNFLWMMFRAGWASKVGQEYILGIWIKKSGFEEILAQSAYSSFKAEIYVDRENWRKDLEQKKARLQWDPDHNIYGGKEERRAIQLGIKGELLQQFNQEMIVEIIDLRPFVLAQKAKIDAGQLSELLLPEERVFRPKNEELAAFLGLDED